MVAKAGIVEARDALEATLEKFKYYRGSDGLLIFESWGHLEAILGCYAFKDMSIVDRQDTVWDFLRKEVAEGHLSQGHLAHLSRVQTLTIDEYKVRCSSSFLPGGKTEILDLDENPGETPDA